MVNGKVSWEETVDTQGCSSSPQTYESYSRDPERTPYQWDGSNKAGFTRGDQTWLPVAANYKENNALSQLRAPRSHLQMFKKLLKLRQEPSMQDGPLEIKDILDDILIYSRYVRHTRCISYIFYSLEWPYSLSQHSISDKCRAAICMSLY